MIRASIVAAVVCAAALPRVGEAQQRWSLELRTGAAFATQDLGDADLGEGIGVEGTVAYRFMPHVSAYGGWDWLNFSTDASFAGADAELEETGYAFGLQFDHPFRGETTGAAYRLRAGATWNHIEIEDPDGDVVADSGHGLGWEVGTGVVVPFGDTWRFTPGVRYRSLGRTLDVGGVPNDVDLTYVSLELGFARRF